MNKIVICQICQNCQKCCCCKKCFDFEIDEVKEKKIPGEVLEVYMTGGGGGGGGPTELHIANPKKYTSLKF